MLSHHIKKVGAVTWGSWDFLLLKNYYLHLQTTSRPQKYTLVQSFTINAARGSPWVSGKQREEHKDTHQGRRSVWINTFLAQKRQALRKHRVTLSVIGSLSGAVIRCPPWLIWASHAFHYHHWWLSWCTCYTEQRLLTLQLSKGHGLLLYTDEDFRVCLKCYLP